jgi:hypothetical protein
MLGSCTEAHCDYPHPPFDAAGDWRPLPPRQTNAVLWEGAPQWAPPPLPARPAPPPPLMQPLGWSPLNALAVGAAAVAAAVQAPPLPLPPAADWAAPAGGEEDSEEINDLLQVGWGGVS